jgi:CheY-like chemotaxis protein
VESQRALRVDNATVRWILDSLDAEEPQPRHPGKGGPERYPYRVPALRVEFQLADGGAARYVAPGRNIGPDGISFLVGNLVYPDSVCKVHLITTHNHWHSVTGKVVRCRYISGTGSVYEADVRFQQPIDLALFVAQALRVRVLLVDDSPTARTLLTQMLKGVSADVVACENGREAIEKALSQHFDVVLMDMEMPVLDGFATTRTLRAKRYAQPIVAVTGLTAPGDRERCLQAGCDDYLTKPPDRDAIADLIDRLRPEPLCSSVAIDHPGIASAIEQFVRDLRLRAQRVQQAYADADLATIEREARAMKAEAPGYGFEPIGSVAAELEDAVRRNLPAPDIYVKLGKLVRLCCVARPSPTGRAS